MTPIDRAPLLACAALLAGSMSLAGCATGGGGPQQPAESVGVTAGADGCAPSVAITEADADAVVCVVQGGTVTVTLRGRPGQAWRPIEVQGDALAPAGGAIPSGGATSSGETTSPGGTTSPGEVTAATFAAAHRGTATVTSSRSACPPASPGSVSCKALQAFTVTIEVR